MVALSELHAAAFDGLRNLAAQLRPPPRSVVVYGSFASGTAGPGSDIDVAVVHVDDDLESDEWASSLASFVADASTTLGNVVSVTELATSEIVNGALDQPFWQTVQATQVVIGGSAITKDRRDTAA